MNPSEFDPDKLTQSQIQKLKSILPCATDGITISEHEKRIRLLEQLNEKLSILILGNEGSESIFQRLEKIDDRLKKVEGFLQHHASDINNLAETVYQSKIQKMFNSAGWKVFLLVFGAVVGAILKWAWVAFVL